MILSPAELVGLSHPPWDLAGHVASYRYVLFFVAMLWAALVARARPVVGLFAGLVYVEIALGFWVMSLGRPYGLFEDPAITRQIAQASVSTFAGPGESFLSGESPMGTGWEPFPSTCIPSRWLLILPSLAPLLVIPCLAILLHLLVAPSRTGALAALLLLAFSTGEPESVRGIGVIPGLWARPGASLLLVMVVALTLVLGRVMKMRWAWLALAGGLCLVWAQTPGSGPGLGPTGTVLLLTLDQGLWVPLAVAGLAREAVAARALVLSGALLLLGEGVLGLGFDPWGAHALYRIGIILAATEPLHDVCGKAGAWLAAAARMNIGEAPRLGAAAMLLAFAPGSFLAWWDPPRIDSIAATSREPVPMVVRDVMGWIRKETPPSAVFMASPEYAPAVAALGGRRVLRAPGLLEAPDDAARWRIEGGLLAGRTPDRHLARYGVSHVFVTPSDFADRGLGAPEDLERYGHVLLRYLNEEGFRVYEIVR